jgi:O-antigen ligase
VKSSTTDRPQAAATSRGRGLLGQSGYATRWKNAAYAVAALIVTLALTGFNMGAIASTVVLMGLLLVVSPPSFKLPVFPTACLVLICTYPLLGFLPQSVFGSPPAWLTVLQDNWALEPIQTSTSQPWVTLGSMLFLWIGCAVWGASVGQGYRYEQRRFGLQVLTLGIGLICLISIAELKGWLEVPWWPRSSHWGQGIGPFANRNHLSTIAAVGIVLAAGVGYDAIRRRSRVFLLFFVASIPCAAAIFMNTSRAGLALMLVGLTAWMGLVGMRRGWVKHAAVSLAVILVVVTVLMIAGTSLSRRLGIGSEKGDFQSTTRLQLYGESVGVFLSHPWQGVGLGNFEDVFKLAAEPGKGQYSIVHPESDFFLALVEGGLGHTIGCLGLVGWFFLSSNPFKRRRSKQSKDRLDRRLRQTTLIAVGLVVVHGIIDVPMHGLRFSVLTAALCGLAIGPRRLSSRMGSPLRWAFQGGGAIVMVFGCWIALSSAEHPPRILGRLSSEHSYQAAVRAANENQLSDARIHLNHSRSIRPLDWRIHFLSAHLHLIESQNVSLALREFGLARQLQPNFFKPCDDEGCIWMEFEPSLAIPAWREAVRRDAKLAKQNYWRWLSLSAEYPKVNQQLWELSVTPSLQIAFLRQPMSEERFGRYIREFLARNTDLDTLPIEDRNELLRVWHDRGDREHLINELQRNPQWQDYGWKILAAHHASQSRFKEAYELALKWLPTNAPIARNPNMSLERLEQAFVFNPTDPRAGMELFWAQMGTSDYDSALRTLKKLEGIPQAPAYLPQEVASVHAAMGDYRQAWESIKTLIEKP